MQVQLQISFFLWTPESRGPMRFSFLYRYLEGTVHNSIPLLLSAAADKIIVRYIRNRSVLLRLMWCRRSGDPRDQSIPLDRSFVCLMLECFSVLTPTELRSKHPRDFVLPLESASILILWEVKFEKWHMRLGHETNRKISRALNSISRMF